MKIILTRLLMLSGVILHSAAYAQTDTISTATLKLLSNAAFTGKKSYAVFFTDSLGKRLSTADIWDRETSVEKKANGQSVYHFNWHWYKSDTLLMEATGVFAFPSLDPISYAISRKGRKPIVVQFDHHKANITAVSQKTKRDTAFTADIKIPAFAFPMDTEILSMISFKKVGQKFMLPFYEPGTATAAWYPLTVTGHENILLPGKTAVNCWVVRLDYNTSGASATFWISEKDHDFLKMQSYFKGRYRYKVKLY